MRTIGIEGIDGAGKSTIFEILAKKLKQELGLTVRILHLNSLIRRDFGLFPNFVDEVRLPISARISSIKALNDIVAFYENHIEVAATECDIVLVDRYKHSFVVRREIYGAIDEDLYHLGRYIPSLNLTIYLKTNPIEAYSRILNSGREIKKEEVIPFGKIGRNEFITYQRKAEKIFDRLFSDEQFDTAKYLILDNPQSQIQIVSENIFNFIKTDLGL
jgi:thymidylate kinase